MFSRARIVYWTGVEVLRCSYLVPFMGKRSFLIVNYLISEPSMCFRVNKHSIISKFRLVASGVFVDGLELGRWHQQPERGQPLYSSSLPLEIRRDACLKLLYIKCRSTCSNQLVVCAFVSENEASIMMINVRGAKRTSSSFHAQGSLLFLKRFTGDLYFTYIIVMYGGLTSLYT